MTTARATTLLLAFVEMMQREHQAEFAAISDLAEWQPLDPEVVRGACEQFALGWRVKEGEGRVDRGPLTQERAHEILDKYRKPVGRGPNKEERRE